MAGEGKKSEISIFPTEGCPGGEGCPGEGGLGEGGSEANIFEPIFFSQRMITFLLEQ